MLVQCLFIKLFLVWFLLQLVLVFVQASALTSCRECHLHSSSSSAFVCVYVLYQVLPPLMQHHVVQPLTHSAKGCVTLVGQWTVCCRPQGRPTCVVMKIFSCVTNSCGWILAQASKSGSFAIDVSEAVVPPKAPNEMWWTQTRALKWAVLCPITHLPRQPFSVAQPRDILEPLRTQNILAGSWR